MERKLTQVELAERADLSEKHLSALERGKKLPLFITADVITKALEISLDELRDEAIKEMEKIEHQD